MGANFDLYPESLEFETGGIFTDAAKWQNIDDRYGAWDDDGTYIVGSSSGSGTAEARYNMTAFVPSSTSITSVTVGVRCKHISGGITQATALVRIGGTTYTGTLTNVGTSYGNLTKTWTTNPNTAAAWTVADLNGLIAGWYLSWAGSGRVDRLTGLWARVAYVGAPTPSDPSQDVGSRHVHDYARAREFVSLAMPLHQGLDYNLLEKIRAVHFAGPHPTDRGWEPSAWQARLLRFYGLRVQPGGSGAVVARFRDLRRTLCLERDDMWTARPAAGYGDGVVRFNKGTSRMFSRSSSAWVFDPASGLCTTLVDNQEAFTSGGWLAFGATTNHTLYSAIQSAGWTKTGTGTNGSAITDETSDTSWFWDPDSTGVTTSVKILAGSPATVDTYVIGTNTASLTAGQDKALSIWYRTESGTPLYYTVRRIVDLNFWRESDQTYPGTSVVWNPLPDTGGAIARYTVPYRIPVGGSNSAFGFRVGFPSGVTSGSVGRVYAHCFESAVVTSWAPPFTSSAGVTRAAGQLLITNNDGARSFWGPQGAVVLEAIPWWTPSDIGNTNKTLLWISHDASNWEWWYYDGTNDQLVYERKVAGNVYKATKSWTPVKGTTYRLGLRHTGSTAELGLTAFTSSVFIDGVKGTDVVTTAAPTEATTCSVEIGSKNNAEHWDGLLRLRRSYAHVPNDSEMARLPRG